MCRSCKRLSHVSINNSTEINEKFVLACLHTGYLNIVGFPSISNQKFKGIERKVGNEIEQVAEESCKKWKKAEIEKEKTGPQQGKLKGSFDVSWRKQRGYNSLVGHGAIFGCHTKKCIDYGTRNAYCRTCQQSMRMGTPANEHDCRQNHSGSAKAMEACPSKELFRKGDYGVMITDEDASSESKVKQNVNNDIEKWSDKNHVVVTFRKMLISGKAQDFGKDSSKLSDSLID